MTQELRRLAEAATQGPWIAAGPSYGASLPVLLNCVVVEEDDGDTDDVCRDVLTSEDALYIAAANPAAILSLLDRLEKAEKDAAVAIGMLADWCVAVDQNGAGWDDWDEHYKDAMYRPCPIRDQLDEAIKSAMEASK